MFTWKKFTKYGKHGTTYWKMLMFIGIPLYISITELEDDD